MEPGISHKTPNGAGCPKPAGLREETPVEEAREGSIVMLKQSGVCEDTAEVLKALFEEDSDAENQIKIVEGEGARKYEEELDPRIQEELEHLNQASNEINKLELQLDDARSSYRRILTDSARRLNAQGSQLGACIEKARPYYEARRLAKEAQQETQKAALRYERAVSMHTAAREMVYVAEQGLLADRNTMDPTWQEMLNHATTKVNEAEEERLHSEQEHQQVTQLCQDAEVRVQTLQKALKKVILKSKPYFELKAQFNQILEEHKHKVVQLEEQVAKVKTHYSVALRNLEQISEQIHAQRGQIRANRRHPTVCGGRNSPVGAEAEVRAVIGHRESGWGQREWLEAEQVSSDCISVISLQTIASDLEKCDSVEHLGDLSDSRSVLGEEWVCDRKPEKPARKDHGGIKLIFSKGHISIMVALKGPVVTKTL
uniref:SH3 domain-binding protein 5 n=1 Tax=Mastacembelus armatus TaxID=205130 RepID=A0A7N8Y5N3_9TELE